MTQPDRFARSIEALAARYAETLTPLGAGLLLAAFENVTRDTRSFARTFDVAHALVLRECVELASEHQLLALEDRKESSQRLFFALTEQAEAMVREALPTTSRVAVNE